MKLPRKIVESDPGWSSTPSEDGYTLRWFNKGLKLIAQCDQHDSFCIVFSTSMDRHLLPDFFDYRNFLTTGDGSPQQIRKYLSSIYLNPHPQDLRLKTKTARRDDPFSMT